MLVYCRAQYKTDTGSKTFHLEIVQEIPENR
jgi:hypothetical protein